jgi:uncharacterized protein
MPKVTYPGSAGTADAASSSVVESLVRMLRYPVKSARPEVLRTAVAGADGLPGDREWACLDGVDGTVGSAKHPGRWGALLEVGAACDGDGVTVTVGGSAYRAGTPEADSALGARLGRAVRLSREVPAGARLHRLLPDVDGMVPTWMDGAPGSETVTPIASGRFADFGAVHLVTTGALAALSARVGAAVPAIRFRPNLVLDAPADPEPGTELRIGGALLRVQFPTPRCVVPGLAQESHPADRAVLSALARHYRRDLPGLGRGACFGVYAEILEPGPLTVGDPVHRG